MAVRTLLQVALVDMTTLVTYRIGDVEGEIVTAFLGSNLQQMGVLLLREVLLEIHVESRATRQVLNIWCAMQLELIDDSQ